MAYARLQELKQYLGLAYDETNDDVLLETLIARATADIDRYTNRTFEAETDTHYFDASALGTDSLTLVMDRDLLSVTELLNGDSDATEITNSYYWLIDRNLGPPYWAIRLKADSTYSWEWDTDCWVSVTGTWGWSTAPPADITHACIRLASYFYHQKDAAVYETIAFPESGMITVPTGMPVDVERMLEPYRKRTL